ncbi:MAG: hypothetical protein K6F28_08735 [Lachnospiraceae bacterium]|nr:hypothetical protein [Lachnospiraceae bacterium]
MLITMILIAAAVFLAILRYSAIKPEHQGKMVGAMFVISAVGGLIQYSQIYMDKVTGPSSLFISILQTLISVGRIYVGANESKSIPPQYAENSIWMICFWIIHFLAYYSMASAAIILLGKNVIRWARFMIMRYKDIELIYGVTPDTVSFGGTLAKEGRRMVLFIGNATPAQENNIYQMGGLLLNDAWATKPSAEFVKKLSLTKSGRNFNVYSISDDEEDNLTFALSLCSVLEESGIDPQRTSLTILGYAEKEGAILQSSKDHYGYGQVNAYDRSEITARLLLLKYPICDVVSFDEHAKASGDIDVLLIGFGPMGKEVLRKVVANGQFAASLLHVTVFDPGGQENDGFYRSRYADMLDTYDITIEPHGGRSRQLCTYIEEHAATLKYIVVSIGNKKTGREIAAEILELLSRKCGSPIPVYQCCDSVVTKYTAEGKIIRSKLCDADVMYGGLMDDLAVAINHYYCGEDTPAKDQWNSCDYFSRMSCRASADYLRALLTRLHLAGSDTIDDETMENLGITEHLRWCAFHYSMGYSCMDKEEWNERAAIFLKEKEETGKGSMRISKNAGAMKHACLIPWDDLDTLSDDENRITGKNIDYKQMDKDNVKVVCSLI